jgi:hypothetical protein
MTPGIRHPQGALQLFLLDGPDDPAPLPPGALDLLALTDQLAPWQPDAVRRVVADVEVVFSPRARARHTRDAVDRGVDPPSHLARLAQDVREMLQAELREAHAQAFPLGRAPAALIDDWALSQATGEKVRP